MYTFQFKYFVVYLFMIIKLIYKEIKHIINTS